MRILTETQVILDTKLLLERDKKRFGQLSVKYLVKMGIAKKDGKIVKE